MCPTRTSISILTMSIFFALAASALTLFFGALVPDRDLGRQQIHEFALVFGGGHQSPCCGSVKLRQQYQSKFTVQETARHDISLQDVE
jgi:hypothetical protein